MGLEKYYGISPHVTLANVQAPPATYIEYMDPDHVLTYVQSGFIDMLINGRIYHLQVGDLFLLPPFEHHVIRRVATSAVLYVCAFDFYYSDVWSAMPRTQRPLDAERMDPRERGMVEGIRVVQLEGWQQGELEKLFLTLLAKREDRQSDNALAIKALFIEMLNIYFKGATREALISSETYTWKTIEKAMQYIKGNYRNSGLSNAEVARHVGVSINYMTSLFTKRIGVSMHRYINGLRIGQACYMIREGDLNYTEIAERVGFSSLQNFCKVFKREIGCTASEFVQRLQKSVVLDND